MSEISVGTNNKQTGKSHKRRLKSDPSQCSVKKRKLQEQDEILSRPFIPVKIYSPSEIWSIKPIPTPTPKTIWGRIKAVFSFE